jgi:diguanylate cyclase (GGDEF)-like protein
MLFIVRPGWVVGAVWAALLVLTAVVVVPLTPPGSAPIAVLERWERWYSPYLVFTLLVWASSIPLMRPQVASLQTAQLLVLVTIANTLVLMGAFLPRLFHVSIAVLSVAIAVELWVWGIGVNHYLALMMPVYVLILVQLQRHMRTATVRGIRLALENEALLRELGRDHDRLEHQARHDHLTGLLNRAAFLELVGVGMAVGAAPRSASPAVAFLDLDHFKAINDEHGHLVGDEVLVQVAERLRSAVRDDDLVGRFGGDEFTVFLRAADETAARRAGERIVAAFDPDVVVGDLHLHIGVSVGIGMAERPGGSAESLIALADASLYRAKSRGRHRVEVAQLAAS